MTPTLVPGGTPPAVPGDRLAVRPIGLDDFSSLRHLHASALKSQTVGVLSDKELAAFQRLVQSPAYSDLLLQEEVYCGWLDGELVGTASWHANADSGATARIGCIFVRHPRFGIGRRLMAEVEARAHQCGFGRFAVSTTANAVPFFEKLGYQIASRGVKTLAPGCILPVTFLKKGLAQPRAPSSSTLM